MPFPLKSNNDAFEPGVTSHPKFVKNNNKSMMKSDHMRLCTHAARFAFGLFTCFLLRFERSRVAAFLKPTVLFGLQRLESG